MAEPLVVLKDVNKHYGDMHALKQVNMTVGKGEVVVLIGPSGSGKSTLIRTINRLETITDGTITIKTIVSAAVSEDGSALLPAKLLGELLRKLDGEIDIASESNAFQAMITAQGSKTSMLCMEAEDFPDIYDVVGEHVTVLPQSRLRDAVGRLLPHAG